MTPIRLVKLQRVKNLFWTVKLGWCTRNFTLHLERENGSVVWHLLKAVAALKILAYRCYENMQLFLAVVESWCLVCGYGHFGECVCRRSAVSGVIRQKTKKKKMLQNYARAHLSCQLKFSLPQFTHQKGVLILSLSTLLLANSAKRSVISEPRN